MTIVKGQLQQIITVSDEYFNSVVNCDLIIPKIVCYAVKIPVWLVLKDVLSAQYRKEL